MFRGRQSRYGNSLDRDGGKPDRLERSHDQNDQRRHAHTEITRTPQTRRTRNHPPYPPGSGGDCFWGGRRKKGKRLPLKRPTLSGARIAGAVPASAFGRDGRRRRRPRSRTRSANKIGAVTKSSQVTGRKAVGRIPACLDLDPPPPGRIGRAGFVGHQPGHPGRRIASKSADSVAVRAVESSFSGSFFAVFFCSGRSVFSGIRGGPPGSSSGGKSRILPTLEACPSSKFHKMRSNVGNFNAQSGVFNAPRVAKFGV